MLSRSVRIPGFFHVHKGAINGIRNILDSEGIDHSKCLVISGNSYTRTTANIVKDIIGGQIEQVSISDSGLDSIQSIQRKILEYSPTLVIGVGGGKVLDV